MTDLPNSTADLDTGLRNALVEVVRRSVPDIDAVYLFGSVARGRTRPGSDVDVALLLPPGRKLSPKELLATMAELESLTHRTVDLSVLNTQTQLVHAKEVITTGVCLFARSQKRIRVFEMQVLSRPRIAGDLYRALAAIHLPEDFPDTIGDVSAEVPPRL